jgi:3-hydroxy-9,10-secoandrosta-1,3,5(10)-triene-9,17-dione monooxygenase
MKPRSSIAASADIPPPEPELTPAAMLARAIALRPLLRARQGDCEALGKVPDDVNAELIGQGFYRIVQPRRFGGYEFDVPTFYKVMMEIARGCTETGWVLALTAGHPLLIANFDPAGQAEVYGPQGEFRCPAAFSPPGTAVAVDGGYRISGGWVSASGCDHGTHFMGMAQVSEAGNEGPPAAIQMVFDASQFAIEDDWDVMGMRGTGSKKIVVKDVFVPTRLTQPAMGFNRGAEALSRARYDANPMYAGRIGPFLIGEAVAVAVGAARGALDHYETLLRTKKAQFPPFLERAQDPEFQRYYGQALALVSTAEAGLVRAGEEFMDYAREEAGGGAPFDDEREQRLTLIEQQCHRLAWEAVELIYRTAGTTASAKNGQPIGRVFRNMAVINTHPALQLDRFGMTAARTRLGSSPPTAV